MEVMHIILLQLISGEKTDSLNVGCKETVQDRVTEGASAADDEERFVIKIHNYTTHIIS